MAKQPHELHQAKLVNALEKALDQELEARFVGGPVALKISPELGQQLTEAVLLELKRRYHGWDVTYEPPVSFPIGVPTRDKEGHYAGHQKVDIGCDGKLTLTPKETEDKSDA